MKYFVLIPDGMADEKIAELGYKTPMEKAAKPYMDTLAKRSFTGMVSNVPVGMVPESDTANLAILSYDPTVYSKGRSPLEAVSMGIEMSSDDTAYRCNIVTLSESESSYDEKILLDHSADEITTDEADVLIKEIQKEFGNDIRRFYTGISYRHCMIEKNGNDTYSFSRPHDIINQCIKDYLPKNDNGGAEFYCLMKESYKILNNHPINEARRSRGLKPANSIWFWSPGKKPCLPAFNDKWGVKSAVISAVDLIKGIGICAGMESFDVEGATGNVSTNYIGKANMAIEAFKKGYNFVYVHVEAPDECGHRNEVNNKILSIENIDKKILKPVYEYLSSQDESFKIMVLPDHPTPISKRTHTIAPVPFFIYSSEYDVPGVEIFSEENCQKIGTYLPNGYNLLDKMIVK